jgi:YgiT-type zinc finger domain-containing protein
MRTHIWKETMVEQKVTYTLGVDDRFVIIENVPARVCLETGERFFSPKTVEQLQQTIWWIIGASTEGDMRNGSGRSNGTC